MIGMTVCSGIGAPELSAPWIGWKYQSEIEPFPAAVLAHRFPDAVNLGDMTKFEEWPDANVDVLCGGTPCQSFSVAGLRKGLDDPRGNLMLTYLAIARRYQPKWLVWENVPGVLSSNGGRDFGALLRGLGELGYGFAYRVLDAQYVRTQRFPWAVPQRRRRVFVVGYLGDWRRAAAVLFDGESLSGNPPPRREAGQRVAPTISARTKGGGGLGTDFDCDGGLIAQDVAPTLNAHFGDKMGLENQHINGGCGHFVAHALRGEGFDASEDGTGRGTPIVPVVTDTLVSNGDAHSGFRDEKGLVPVAIQERAVSENPENGPDGVGCRDDGASYTLEARTTTQAVAFAENQKGEVRTSDVASQLNTGGGKPGQGYPAIAQPYSIMPMNSGKDYKARKTEVAQPLMAGGPVGGNQGGDFIAQPWAVRRLTPTECHRLQGFPDDWCRIPWRGKPADQCPDGPQYKCLGNSWAINCGEWIFDRIKMVEQMT